MQKPKLKSKPKKKSYSIGYIIRVEQWTVYSALKWKRETRFYGKDGVLSTARGNAIVIRSRAKAEKIKESWHWFGYNSIELLQVRISA